MLFCVVADVVALWASLSLSSNAVPQRSFCVCFLRGVLKLSSLFSNYSDSGRAPFLPSFFTFFTFVLFLSFPLSFLSPFVFCPFSSRISFYPFGLPYIHPLHPPSLSLFHFKFSLSVSAWQRFSGKRFFVALFVFITASLRVAEVAKKKRV